MKIIDCFIFYNELDLLKYRLAILNEFVDYFIIVESSNTFTGKEKKLHYDENKELFDIYKEKIIHIVVNDMPYKFPNIDFSQNHQWSNEFHQRNAISKGIKLLDLSDNDIIIISDVDEIPNPDILLEIKNNKLKIEISSLEQHFYYYNLNTKISAKWYYSKILTYKKYIDLLQTCNELRLNNYQIINNGGWHLSYFGDEYFIQNKILNFSHQEFNNETFTNIDTIKNKINSSKDLFGRENYVIPNNSSVRENNDLPPKFDIYLKNYYK